MKVSRWKTPAQFFDWPHVQKYVDGIDEVVYQAAIECAQEEFLAKAKPCPQCRCEAAKLFWFSVSDSESAWDAGTGRVGFLTLCKRCKLQVNFLVDKELTKMQADQWRECRTLS